MRGAPWLRGGGCYGARTAPHSAHRLEVLRASYRGDELDPPLLCARDKTPAAGPGGHSILRLRLEN